MLSRCPVCTRTIKVSMPNDPRGPAPITQRAADRPPPGRLAAGLLGPAGAGLPAHALHHSVRPGEHQAGMPVVEVHQIWRRPAGAFDLDDLPHLVRLAHAVAVHVKPVTDGCLHACILLRVATQRTPAHRLGVLQVLTLTVYPHLHGNDPG